MSLQNLYQSILASLNAVTDESGLISIRNEDGDLLPCTIDDLRLALPTKQLLTRGSWREHGLQPFHPLSEHLNRGESPVLKKLRTLIQVRLTISYQEILLCLASLCADKKQHSDISPKGKAVLQVMPNATEKTVVELAKVLEHATTKSVGNVVKVFLRRGGTYEGRKVPRLCVIKFPLLDEFEGEEPVVHGVKMSKKDFNGLRALLQFVTPGTSEVETYGAGSTSDFAPYFDALIRAYIKAAERLNSLIHLYRKHLDNENSLKIDLSWVSDFYDMANYRNDIPPLSGNEGEILTEDSVGIQRATMIDNTRQSRDRLSSMAATSSHRTPHAAPVSVPDEPDVRQTNESKPSGIDVDAAIRALRTSNIPQIAPPQAATTGSTSGEKTFAQLMEERQRSLYGNAPQPMYHPQMMPGQVQAAPGTYAGFQYGQPAMMPMGMYPQVGYPNQMMAPMQPMGNQMYGQPYPPMYPNMGIPYQI